MSELNSQEKQCSETLVVFYWKIPPPTVISTSSGTSRPALGVLMCFWCIREESQKLPFPARNLGYRVGGKNPVVNRILSEQRPTGHQLPHPKGYLDLSSPERILGAEGEQSTVNSLEQYRKLLQSQTKLRIKLPRAPNCNSNKLSAIKSES